MRVLLQTRGITNEGLINESIITNEGHYKIRAFHK